MRAIYLIARREYLSYVATWGFWLSLASVPLFMALGFGLPILIESSQPTRYYALIDETGGRLEEAVFAGMTAARDEEIAEAREQIEAMVGQNPQVEAAFSRMEISSEDGRYIRIDPGTADLETLRPALLGEATVDTPDGPQPLFAAIYLRDHPEEVVEIEYWSANLTDGALRGSIRRALRDHIRMEHLIAAGLDPATLQAADDLAPLVRELNPERTGDGADVTQADRIPMIMSIAAAFGLWVIVFSVVNMLLTAMIEEKGNKVLEMMLASSRHHEILSGKLLGVAAVSATLLFFWGGIAMSGGLLTQQVASDLDLPLAEILAAVFDPALLGPAAAYFVIGYLMYGAVFLAVGSLCETIHDAQTLMSPIMLVMMAPLIFIMVGAESPDSPVIQFASWVPLWTPFIMMARLPHDPAMIEIIGTTLGMLATAIIVIWGAGVMFRMGALNQANQDTVKGWFTFGKKSA